MATDERQQVRQMMLESVTALKDEIEDLKVLTQPIPPENAIGRLSRMDAINNKTVNEAALRSAELRLSKLEIALRRVDSSDFGICKRCSNPIPVARLLFVPETDRCVTCADKR